MSIIVTDSNGTVGTGGTSGCCCGFDYLRVDKDAGLNPSEFALVDTSKNAVSIFLPAKPKEFTRVGFLDIKSSFSVNSLTITPSGEDLLMGLSETMTVSMDNVSGVLIYTNGDWRIVW